MRKNIVYIWFKAVKKIHLIQDQQCDSLRKLNLSTDLIYQSIKTDNVLVLQLKEYNITKLWLKFCKTMRKKLTLTFLSGYFFICYHN